MNLLIVTQTVDRDDPVLGFFHDWIRALAPHAGRVEVICLAEGAHELPANVRVHSLGKEHGRPGFGSAAYARRLVSLAWRLRRSYDAVFVHMAQEYVLAAGWLWKLLGKRVSLWRNHYAGSWRTDLAVVFCDRVFCTSKASYTAKYRKTLFMPVGVDTSRFCSDPRVARVPRSILFLARMAPSKRPEMLLAALETLARDSVSFTATLVGSPAPGDEAYYDGLKARVRERHLDDRVVFHAGVAPSEAPDVYRSHQIFVNASPSGMLDKTIFEAAACGCTVLAASPDFAALAGPDAAFDTGVSLAERLEAVLAGRPLPPLAAIVEQQSLSVLSERLARAL